VVTISATRLVLTAAVLVNLVQVGRADSYTFTPINVPGATNTTVTGIDNAGQIVGHYSGTQFHGFVEDGGRFTIIDPPGSVGTHPLGINSAGQIVGWFNPTITASIVRGFLYDRGSFTTIDAPVALPMNVVQSSLQGSTSPVRSWDTTTTSRASWTTMARLL